MPTSEQRSGLIVRWRRHPPTPARAKIRAGGNAMAEFTKTVTVNCPYCESSEVVKNGNSPTGNQRYRCKSCAKTFTDTGAVHGRVSNVIGAAVQKFYRGLSYKSIAEQLAQDHDIPEPSKQTIYAWVKKYTDDAVKAIAEHPAETGPEWVADEMAVNVGGRKMWNWNVMDAKTRYVLASYLSPRRDTEAATRTLRKAKRAAANPAGTHPHRPTGFLHRGHQTGVPERQAYPVGRHHGESEQQPLGAVAGNVPTADQDAARIRQPAHGSAVLGRLGSNLQSVPRPRGRGRQAAGGAGKGQTAV